MAGCCTGMGRVILIILNSIFFLVSLGILALGVLLKFFGATATEFMLGLSGTLNNQTRADFHIPDLKDIAELPFLDNLGLILLVFGCTLCCISFLACCGACCKWRPLLVMFVVVMILLVIAQGVVGGLFLQKDSALHSAVKTTLGTKIKNEFDRDGKDVFSYSINMLNYQLSCCGIRGWQDFAVSKPPSCCNRTIIDDDVNWVTQRQQCTADPPTAPDAFYNPQGCYAKLQEAVMADFTLSALVLAVILFLQVLEIVFACLIVKDVNESNTKVGPWKE